MIGAPTRPVVRELRCSKCKLTFRQRMLETGLFEPKPKVCPGCNTENSMGVIRIYTTD